MKIQADVIIAKFEGSSQRMTFTAKETAQYVYQTLEETAKWDKNIKEIYYLVDGVIQKFKSLNHPNEKGGVEE